MFNYWRNYKINTLKLLLRNKRDQLELMSSYISLLEQRNKMLEKTLREIEVRYV